MDNKNKILQAAIEEFGSNIYKSASTNKIIARAETSKGLLFHYFLNKENLFLECSRFVLKDYIQFVQQEIKKNCKEKNLYNICFLLIESEYNWSIKNNLYARLFNNFIEYYNLKKKYEFECIFDEFSRMLSKIILENCDEKNFRSDIKKDIIVKFILMAINSILKSHIDEDSEKTFEEKIKNEKLKKEFGDYIKIIEHGVFKV